MSSKEKKKANEMTHSAVNLANQRGNQQYESNMNQAGYYAGQGEQTRGAALAGFDEMAGGGLTAEQQGRMRGSVYQAPNFNSGMFGEAANLYRDFMGSGGVDESKLHGADPTFQDIMTTGGWSDAAKAGVSGDVSGLRTIGRLGAGSEEAVGRIRGGGVYDDFAKTGGFSNDDISNIRTRATSPLASYYGGMRTDIERLNRINGSSAGNTALLARMGKDRARAIGDTSLAAETDISDRVRAGKQWGATNMSGAEQFLGNQQIAGLTSAAGIEGNMAQTLASNRMQAGTTLDASQRSIANMIQQGKMFGTSGLSNIASEEARANQFAASEASGMEKYITGLTEENQANATRGYAGMSEADADRAAQYTGMAANVGNAQTATNLNAANSLAANNPSHWGDVGKYAGMAAAVGGAAFTGGASLAAIPALSRMGGGGPGADWIDPGMIDAMGGIRQSGPTDEEDWRRYSGTNLYAGF